MKSKFATIIMCIIIILIIGILGIFGVIFWEELQQMETSVEPESFKTVISETSNTVDKNIETPPVRENILNDIKDENQNNNVNYNNIKVDKYFYNQLEDESKTIYKAFEANQENLKSGNYKIELGNSFSNLLKKEDGQEQLGKYYQSAFEAYNYDNPEVFYLNPNKMYLNIETTTSQKGTTYYVYISSGEQNNYFTDDFSSKEQVDTASKKIEEVKNNIIANKTGNTYDDIKMVHDYLVDNVEYDTSISQSNIYDIYGALVNNVAVCEGYARAFKYIMDEMNIPCVLVIGQGKNSQGQTENHAWNYVELNNKWYAIDVTWDDPVVTGGGRTSKESRYKYFLKGSNTFLQDHVPSGQFTPNGKVFEYPDISKEDL